MSFSGYGLQEEQIIEPPVPEKVELIEGGDVSSAMREYLDKIKSEVMQKEKMPTPEAQPKKSFLSSFNFMSSSMFDKCTKAPWQPPNSVFPVVWTFLYTVYFVLLAKTWKSTSSRNSLLIGLILNIAWIPAFAYNAKAGLAILAIMIGVAFDTSRRLELDGYHTLNNWFQPYLVWLIFAFTLNLYIVANCS
jgi:tryptophan-rich sensory protein